MAWLTGYQRELVEWYPTLDATKCLKCGMCMNCGKHAYAWTDTGAAVARPYDCIVGCNTCANLCLGEAISFPDIQSVRTLYRQEGLCSKVKRQLQEEGELVVQG